MFPFEYHRIMNVVPSAPGSRHMPALPDLPLNEAQAIAVLAALAQEHRLRIFRALVAAQPEGLHPRQLAEALAIAPATLSFHLKELVQSELIRPERQGRGIVYTAQPERVGAIVEYLMRDCCGGVSEASRLSRSSPFWAWLSAESCPTFTGVSATPTRAMNVLFVCTGNSARSPMAEALLNHLGAGRFRAFSAGSEPRGFIAPEALQVLRESGVPFEGLRSKGWLEFVGAGAPELDLVFTVCDGAAGEVCPVWPGAPIAAHWGVEDPAGGTGSPDQRLERFRETGRLLRQRIESLLALPIAQVDRMALGQQLQGIGGGAKSLDEVRASAGHRSVVKPRS